MITFFDADGNITENSNEATRFEIKEFDANDNVIFLSMGDLE